ncbi:hypothetical protein CFBP498_26760 [Xanthomonas hortorum pv. vitians]|uniref:Uncharacterized protein n=2 Tax=Xanthomonas hortorum TaxID=56454 RepID=A0A6V7DSG2_9XANT|nr:hypothetical protein CFBP498_26760 [Xanthomonas hortorum pv. vitians]CAD0339731.1 hypothetical protein CFBP498_26760 [Xanthomonas hortorum pv. vitians]
MIPAMNSGIQITARSVNIVRGDPSVDASLEAVEVNLSAAPSPRWQACFEFVAQDRQGSLWRERPQFDRDVLRLLAVKGQVAAIRQEIPDLVSAASRLSFAQGLIDSR